jgi:hypothetical protein
LQLNLAEALHFEQNYGESNMNARKIKSHEDKSRTTNATVARSMARTTVCLVIIVLAAASSFAQLASVPDTYIGIWRRYQNGKMVGTVQLLNYKGKLTGTFSGSRGSIGDDGAIQIWEIPGAAPIVESSLSGGDLHLVLAGPEDTTNDLKMTLTGPDKAHLTCYGHNGRTIELELKRISMDENEAVHVQYQ